jgi:hypothetical protein
VGENLEDEGDNGEKQQNLYESAQVPGWG